MIGQTISHYQISEKLGEGGMGVVYKAYDTKLKRHVALKFLSRHLLTDEQQRKRFIHEAQAAAGLTHPHICTVHEIHEADGHTFMVMEYIEGESLGHKIESGALDVGEALDVAIQVSKGLSKAHDQGIVHRDIKPGNVLMTPEGDAKIVDFGLAKLAAQTRLTKTGATVGTVMYMSPEQAKGGDVDHRTDIWSVGVMLYEMLTGKLPFRGEVEHAVVYSIMNEDPEPITSTRKDVPIALEELVEKALAKDPEKRYATVNEFLTDLEEERDRLTLGIKERRFAALRRLRRRKRLTMGVATVVVVVLAAVLVQTFYEKSAAIDSIAVLPLENLSGDPEQDYLVDGITGDLTAGLSRVSAFERVTSRKSAMRYKGTDKPLQDIARDLNVKAFVAGTVQPVDGQFKLAVELIHAGTGENLWSDIFEKNVGDIQTLINEITRTVAGEMNLELTPEEDVRLAVARPIDPEAYDAYLRGRYLFEHDFDAGELSHHYFQEALAIDSMCAPAYAALAESYFQGTHYKWIVPPDPEAASKAKAAALKAVEIDEMLAEGHAALAHVLFEHDYDFPAAEKEFKQAFELNPSYTSDALAYCIYAYMLESLCRFDEAADAMRRAVELDPTSRFIATVSVEPMILAGRYEQAIDYMQKTAEMFPDWVRKNDYMSWISARQGDYAEAARHLENLDISGGDFEPEYAAKIQYLKAESYRAAGRMDDAKSVIDALIKVLATLESAHPIQFAILHAFNGEKAEARAYLEEAMQDTTLSPLLVARTYMELGDLDETFAWLEKTYDARIIWLVRLRNIVEFGFWNAWMGTKRTWEPIRNDPRYHDLIKKIGLIG